MPTPPLRPHAGHPLTRRALVGAGVVLGLALAGCGGKPRPPRWGRRFLAVATTGGALRQTLYAALFDPFRTATGCTVQDVSLPAREIVRELRRQALGGRMQWDAVVLDAAHAALATRQTPDLFRPATGPLLAIDTLALAHRAGPLGDRPPATWAAAWTEMRAVASFWPDDPVGLLEVALLADGVAPNALYPLDLDRAFASLDRLRQRAPAWWQRSARAGEALALGQADLLLGYGGEARAAIAGGADATIAALPMPQLPLLLNVPSGSPNNDVARDFVAFAQGDGVRAALREQGYGLPEGTLTDAIAPDLGWWGEFGGTALARFEQWRGMVG